MRFAGPSPTAGHRDRSRFSDFALPSRNVSPISGEKAAAEAEYREGVRLDPKNPSFRNWLVTFLEKEGRRDEAEAIRKEAPTR
jgi:hypothetical protein